MGSKTKQVKLILKNLGILGIFLVLNFLLVDQLRKALEQTFFVL